jgi:hypothetical protein
MLTVGTVHATHVSDSLAFEARHDNGGTVNKRLEIALSAGFISLAAACSNNTRPAETALAEPAATEGASATESIAEARCARESRCDNIGGDKKFSSMEDCIARVREDWKDELSARECRAGINQTQLGECLNSVRNEECSNPLDTLERVSACTAGQICVDNG